MVQINIRRRHVLLIAALVVAGLVVLPSISEASHTFDDVPDDNVFHSDIDWLAANGITKGCNPAGGNTEFCPGNPVTRQQMAAFMRRLATSGAVDAGAVGGLEAAALLDRIDELEATIASLESQTAALEDILAGVSRSGDTLLMEGLNVQIVNGSGYTSTANGLGNLIIGYNESDGDDRSGSHFLVIGELHSYSTAAGIVAGYDNTVSGGYYASVVGGSGNTSGEYYATVVGGQGNLASGPSSVVLGGRENTASNDWSMVSGGRDNTASGWYASVTGGQGNTAAGQYASVTAGQDNTASSSWDSVAGGYGNTANQGWASVSGGQSNNAAQQYASVSGGSGNTASGNASSVSGGTGNTASGSYSSVSGGSSNTADGAASSILGGELVSVATQYGHYPS